MPLTAKNEYGTTDYQGEGPTEADRVPNAIVVRTLARDIPSEVGDHGYGLEQIVESLAWVCGRSGEHIIEPIQKVTNETRCFPTYVARQVVGQSYIFEGLYTRRLALSLPIQVGTQLSRWTGSQFRLVAKRNYSAVP